MMAVFHPLRGTPRRAPKVHVGILFLRLFDERYDVPLVAFDGKVLHFEICLALRHLVA